MGQYRNIGSDPVGSPFYANGEREIQSGEIVELPEEQADGSPLYWSPMHFERQDGENPIHALYAAEQPVEHPNVVIPPPESTPPRARAVQHSGKTNPVGADGGEKE